MKIRETFARSLRTLRQARKMSLEELAHRAGVDRAYISSRERCVYNPSIEVLDRLAAVLAVEPADLLKKSDKE
ncbi:helix-turn-helix domain-containing protein [Rhizobium leguminosarum]|uniref:helix-turn-helix domain-containing protein n=1 Tax=Rhizobium leguminosarum TaxID=384 RepID=UPI00140FA963|nr:helix-turn-helix transcriptional regulator [Rhizobium leguminosarum]QIO61999.1 helix-turn-helix transcriptional regulator [Rhizobium leguminosarum bv. trifolii]